MRAWELNGFGRRSRLRRSSIPHARANDPIPATCQYSPGKSSVVVDRSASVMIHSLSPASVS